MTPALRSSLAGRITKVLAVVGLTAFATTACGSNKSTSGTSSGGDTKSLGSPDKATGAPVMLGMISDGGPTGIPTAPAIEQGLKAAIAYANDYRGGLAGHEIKLDVCEDNFTPSGAQSCASQMVRDNVVAALVPVTGQGPSIVPILAAHKVPYVSIQGASAAELTTPGSFSLSGGYAAELGAFALDAKARGFTSFAMLTEDVPAAIQGAQVFGGMVFKSAGVTFKVIPVAPGTADMTPQLQSAVNWGAKAIGITSETALCSSFLKSYQSLALTVPKYVIPPCLDQSIYKSLGGVLNGSFVGTTSHANASDKEMYGAILSKYAPGVDTNPTNSANQATGYVGAMGFVNAMRGVTGEMTSATVENELATAKNVPLPLSGGITFTCDGTAVPLLKAVCEATTEVGITNGIGVINNTQTYNPTPLFR